MIAVVNSLTQKDEMQILRENLGDLEKIEMKVKTF
jgi:hypothetical protein